MISNNLMILLIEELPNFCFIIIGLIILKKNKILNNLSDKIFEKETFSISFHLKIQILNFLMIINFFYSAYFFIPLKKPIFNENKESKIIAFIYLKSVFAYFISRKLIKFRFYEIQSICIIHRFFWKKLFKETKSNNTQVQNGLKKELNEYIENLKKNQEEIKSKKYLDIIKLIKESSQNTSKTNSIEKYLNNLHSKNFLLEHKISKILNKFDIIEKLMNKTEKKGGK